MSKIWIVDSDPDRQKILRLGIKGRNHLDKCFSTPKEALEALRSQDTARPDIVIISSDSEPSSTKELIKALDPLKPERRIVWTKMGFPSSEDRNKGHDWLCFPACITDLQNAIERLGDLGSSEVPPKISSFGKMRGASAGMQRVFRLMVRAASSENPVLLEGEPGTGKEAAARAIHDHSPRSQGAFARVSCDEDRDWEKYLLAVDHSLELGSKATAGLLKHLEGGTLYVAEIDRAEPILQRILGRVLEGKIPISPKCHKERRANVRIIAGCSRPLAIALEEKAFIPELYYRLSSNRIELPTLRARHLEIPSLAFAVLDPRKVKIYPDVLDILMNYSWPGNLDEFFAVLEAASGGCADGWIRTSDLPSELEQAAREDGRGYKYVADDVTEPAESER